MTISKVITTVKDTSSINSKLLFLSRIRLRNTFIEKENQFILENAFELIELVLIE